MTHVPEVVLLLSTASIAVAPALGGWLLSFKDNTAVEMISIVGLTLLRAWSNERSILSEGKCAVLRRVFLSVSETIGVLLWSGVAAVISEVSDVKSMILIPMFLNVFFDHLLSIMRDFLWWVIVIIWLSSLLFLVFIILFHVSMLVLVSVVQIDSSDLLHGDQS